MSKPKIFVPNDANIEFTNLGEWGEIIPIFSGYIYPDTFGEMEVYTGQAKRILDGFDPGIDMVALIGDPALQALCILIIGQVYDINRMRVLKYDKRLNAYYPVTLDTTRGQNV